MNEPMKTFDTKTMMMIVTTAVAAAIGSFGASYAVKSGSEFFQSTEAVDKSLASAANQINKNLPMSIDAYTVLNATTPIPGKKFLYRYTVVKKEELPEKEELVEAIRSQAINNYKTSTSMADFRKHGVTLIYEYFDETGKEFFHFEITPNDIK